MRVAITGGCGFVGANLAIYLKRKYKDLEIIALDNLKRRGSEFNIKRLKEVGIEFLHADVRYFEDVNIKFDILIEASAEPSVLAGLDGKRRYLIDTNLNGLINCAEAALRNKAKIIFLSSSRIYPIDVINSLKYKELKTRYKLVDDSVGIANEGFNENFTIQGKNRTLYGATKLSAEMILNEYRDMFGLDFVINRCGVIAGAWQFGRGDQGVVPFWVMSYVFDKELAIFGNGKQVRDILNVEDLARLIEKEIFEFDKFNGETFNVGGGIDNSLSILELDLLCKNFIKDKKVEFKEERGLDIKYYVTDNSKISKYWKPRKSITDTLLEIIEWVSDNKTLLRELL